MGISHDCMDCSGLLSKFSSLILDYCKLLSENIHFCVVGSSLVACWEFWVFLHCLLFMVTLLRAIISVAFQFLMAASFTILFS